MVARVQLSVAKNSARSMLIRLFIYTTISILYLPTISIYAYFSGKKAYRPRVFKKDSSQIHLLPLAFWLCLKFKNLPSLTNGEQWFNQRVFRNCRKSLVYPTCPSPLEYRKSSRLLDGNPEKTRQNAELPPSHKAKPDLQVRGLIILNFLPWLSMTIFIRPYQDR